MITVVVGQSASALSLVMSSVFDALYSMKRDSCNLLMAECGSLSNVIIGKKNDGMFAK